MGFDHSLTTRESARAALRVTAWFAPTAAAVGGDGAAWIPVLLGVQPSVAGVAEHLALRKLRLTALGAPRPHAVLELLVRIAVMDLKIVPRAAVNA